MGINGILRDVYNVFYKCDEPMKNHTTLGVGGTADYYVVPNTLRELTNTVDFSKVYNIPCKIIGNGSNLLVSDKGYRGIIVNTKNLNFISQNGDYIKVCCGTRLNDFILYCNKIGCFGYESLYGIPSTIGGAIIQNAGALNRQISDCLSHVVIYRDGKIQILSKNECGFLYRDSKLKQGNLTLLYAFFSKDSFSNVKEKNIEEVIEFRKARQPKGKTCGSVFLNGNNYFSGDLIEKSGLKGYTVGKARVSTKHANFIENYGDSAQDIYDLIMYIKKRVFDKFRISLNEEVEFVGEF